MTNQNSEIIPARPEGFVCITRELTWGWGATISEAVKMARRTSGGRGARKGERLVVQMPTGARDARVDQMGRVVWDWADDAPDRTATTITLEEPN